MPILIKGSGGKKPKLQSGSGAPETYDTTFKPDSGYDGFSVFTLSGYTQTKPTGGDAKASDARSGETFYSGGSIVTGTIKDITLPVPTITTSYNSDKTKLTVTSSYTPPSVGYVPTEATQYLSKTIVIDKGSNVTCEYTTTQVVFSSASSDRIYTWDIAPDVDGRSLKYAFISQADNSIVDNNSPITNIMIDVGKNNAYITYFNYDGSNIVSTSLAMSGKVTLTNGSDGYTLTTISYGVFGYYDCLAVYQ